MKLNKEMLERSMANAKANFNKACDKVMKVFKALDSSVDKFQEELMDKEERPCNCGCCHCHDKEEVQEAVEPEFELENKDDENQGE